jgi:DNA repair exonuclease SbcCD ATPase subunit
MVNFKYAHIFLTVIILAACTDRDIVPNPPDRYDDVYSFSSEIDPEEAKYLYEQYLRERMDLETKYRNLLSESKATEIRQTIRNINQEVQSFGRVNLPELMDALRQVQEEVRRQNLFVDELSNTLNELGRDPMADESIQKALSFIAMYEQKYRELYNSLEEIYLTNKKVELQPNKKQRQELEQQIKSARFLATSVQRDIEGDLD